MKLLVIILTFNKKNILYEHLMKLKKQDCTFDILIFDNASTDGTFKFIEHLLNDNILYKRIDTNEGFANGFYTSLKYGYELSKYDYFLLCDDDGMPLNDQSLSSLVAAAERKKNNLFILSPLVIYSDSSEPCLTKSDSEVFLNRYIMSKKKMINHDFYNNVIMRSKEGIIPGSAFFVGTLIPKQVIEEIGYPMRELKYHGVEVEYMLRAIHSNVNVYTTIGSIYTHPKGVWKEIKVFNKNYCVRDFDAKKIYYTIRSQAFISMRYYGITKCVTLIIKSFCKIPLYSDKKINLLKSTFRGLRDGFKENFNPNI